VQLLGHSDHRIRLKTLRLAALYGQNKSELYLLAMKDSSFLVRSEALEGLATEEWSTLPCRLLPFIADENPLIHQGVVRLILDHMTPEVFQSIVDIFNSCNEQLRPRIASLLARSNRDDAFGHLFPLMLDRRQPAEFYIEILNVLHPSRIQMTWKAVPLMLKKGDRLLLKHLALYLRRVTSKGITAALTKNLAHTDPVIRQGATYLLGQLGQEESAAPIAAMLQDPIDPIRIQAAWALVFLGARHTLDLLGDFYRQSSNMKVRKALLEILMKLDHEGSLPYIIEALADPGGEIRAVASRLLGSCKGSDEEKAREELWKCLNDRDEKVILSSLFSLLQLGEKHLPFDEKKMLELIPLVVLDPSSDSERKKDVLEALMSLAGERGIDILRDLAGSSIPVETKEIIIDTVARMDTPASREFLCSILGEETPSLQGRAALRLCKAPAAGTCPALLRFLRKTWYRDDPSLIVIYTGIIETVNHMMALPPDQELVDCLIELVQHRDTKVRLMAAYQLGRVKSGRAADALLPLLDSSRHSLRAIAAMGLGNHGAAQAVPILRLILEDRELEGLHSEREIRHQQQELDYYYQLLEEEPAGESRLAGDRKKAAAFSYLLAMKSPESLQSLAFHCLDRDPATVMSILKSIAASRDPSFIPALVQLKGKRGEVGIQQAIDSLLRRQPEAVADYLTGLVEKGGEAQRLAAARTWVEVKEVQVPELQEKFIRDSYWPVRYWVLKNLSSGKNRAGGPVPTMPARAFEDPSCCIRTLALQGLEGGEKSEEHLRKALLDRHFFVRAEACRIVASLKYEALEKELIANLEHSCYAVRMAAARALGELKSRPAFPRLKAMLKQCTLPEKIWLYFALSMLTGEKKYWIFTPFLNLPEDDHPEGILSFRQGEPSFSEYSDRAIAHLNRSGFRPGPVISRAEFDEILTGERDFLLRVVRNLDRLYVEKNSERKESLFQAIEALGAFAVPETISMLGEIITSDRARPIKMAVMKALNGAGTGEAYLALLPGLADPAPEIYIKTAQLLKKADPALILPHLEALLNEGKTGAKQRELIAELARSGEKR